MRAFSELHVYSAGDHSLAEVYDVVEEEILLTNVWVFRPDGTFDAKLEIQDDIIAVSYTHLTLPTMCVV